MNFWPSMPGFPSNPDVRHRILEEELSAGCLRLESYV